MTSLSGWLIAELRRWAYLGARHGPTWWLRHSPGAIGALAFAISRAEREALARRLAPVLGRRPRRRELLQVFSNFAHCLAETLAGPERGARFQTHGAEPLRAQLAGNRGVILLTAHTGAWELAASKFAREFARPVVLVMTAERSSGARRVHQTVRSRSQVRTLYVGDDPFAGVELAAAVADGAILAFQLDRPAPSGRGFETRFFSSDLQIPEGPLRLARATGAPLVSAFCARVGFQRYHLQLSAPLFLPRGADAAALALAAQALTAGFEDFLRLYPLQWFAFETPPGPSGARRLA